MLYWIRPPIVTAAREAAELRRRWGIPYAYAREAHQARLHLLPPSLDLRSGLIVDLGANAGDWTAAVARIDGVHVLAVEPFPSALQRLRQRFGSAQNVRLDGHAVSSTRGEARFHVAADDVFGSLLEADPELEGFYGSEARTIDTITVPTITLDDLVGEQAVSLMKIDVQGAELDVFDGGQRTLDRTQAILIEANFAPHYKGGSRFSEVDEALTARGFVLWDLTHAFRDGDGRMLWADALYVRAAAST